MVGWMIDHSTSNKNKSIIVPYKSRSKVILLAVVRMKGRYCSSTEDPSMNGSYCSLFNQCLCLHNSAKPLRIQDLQAFLHCYFDSSQHNTSRAFGY